MSCKLQTFCERMAWLMQLCRHSANEQQPNTLDKLECSLYAIGEHTQNDFAQWKHGLVTANAKLQPVAKRSSTG